MAAMVSLDSVCGKQAVGQLLSFSRLFKKSKMTVEITVTATQIHTDTSHVEISG